MFPDNREQRLLRRFCLAIHEVHDGALVLADNPRVRLRREVTDRRAVPVVTPRQPVRLVHALLDNRPLSLRADNERVKVDLKSVGDRIVVDPRGQPAGSDESFAVQSLSFRHGAQLVRSIPRMPAPPAADVDPKLVRPRCEAPLQSAHDRRGDPGRVPVHSHDAAERLKPEGIGKAGEKFRSAVTLQDRLDNGCAELGHAPGEPLRHTPAVKGEVGKPGSLHHSIIT